MRVGQGTLITTRCHLPLSFLSTTRPLDAHLEAGHGSIQPEAKKFKTISCFAAARPPAQSYRLRGFGFSVRVYVKLSKPQPLRTMDLRMFLARTETNLPTKDIALVVREDAFPHELHLRRQNRFLGVDNATNTRSRQQPLGAVTF